MHIYTVIDRKANQIGPLFTLSSVDVAFRALATSFAKSNDEVMKRYPQDFDLLDLGEIDVETGSINGRAVIVAGNVADIVGAE